MVKSVVGGVQEEFLVVHLKSLKEHVLSKGVNVEMFSTGTFSCPVEAWKKWKGVSKIRIIATKPIFRFPDGKCLTGVVFNKIIKSLLGQYINYDEGIFLSHSFMAGMASMMALLGYKDSDIMRQGRWASNAFLQYCKLGRANRLNEQRKLASDLAKYSK